MARIHAYQRDESIEWVLAITRVCQELLGIADVRCQTSWICRVQLLNLQPDDKRDETDDVLLFLIERSASG